MEREESSQIDESQFQWGVPDDDATGDERRTTDGGKSEVSSERLLDEHPLAPGLFRG